ncbi:hypothetical protein DV736_g1942, partial [Chaetothyriales sp. CBS 134916]
MFKIKAVTVAAGAALVSSVFANNPVHKLHQQLHARSGWNDWSNTTTSTTSATPVADTTATTPLSTSSLSDNWGEWDTSSASVEPTSSTASGTETWAEWGSSSSIPVVDSTTPSFYLRNTNIETGGTWAEWSSAPTELGTSTEPAASTEPADSTEIWAEWSSTSTDPATPTETWDDWSDTVTTTIHSTITATIYLSALPSSSAATSSSNTPVVVTSTVNAWSSGGWFGAPWPSDETLCVQQILTSYGPPTWYPTPENPQATETPSDTSSVWDDWSSSSPVVETSTSAIPSSLSSAPVVETSTSTIPSSPSSTPVVETSTSIVSSSWAEWSTSDPSNPATDTWAEWSTSDPGDSATDTWAEWSTSASSTPTPAETSVPAVTTSWPEWSSSDSGDSVTDTWAEWSTSASSTPTPTETSVPVVTTASESWGKGFSSVRVYSTDCSTLENVGSAAKSNNLKIILGVFISSTGISGAQQQITDITSWAQWDLVELIVVGNEAVFNGYVSASALAGFISSSRSSFQAAGYTGLVSTTEPLDIWQNDGSAFCDVVDVVAGNLYAFFNAQTTADEAGSLIQAQIGILEGICSGKGVYVMESGWPTAGECNGVACPSPENQETALKGIQATSGSKIVFFSFEDDAWKAPGTGHMITSLREDKVDICIGLTEGWVAGLLNDQGQRLKGYSIVGSWVETPLRWAVVTGRNRDTINSIDDLKQNKKVGVSRLGSGSHVMAFVLADQEGWLKSGTDEKLGLAFVPLGPFSNLRDGVIDKGAEAPVADFFMWEHFTTKPYFHGDGTPLKKIGEIYTPWPSWHIAASTKTFPHPKTDAMLEQLFAALDEGIKEFGANPDHAVKMLGTGEVGCHYTEEDAREWLKDVKFSDSVRGVSEKTMDHVVKVLQNAGVIAPSVEIKIGDGVIGVSSA